MDIFEAYEVSTDAVKDGIWAELILMGKQIGRIRVRPSDPDLNHDYRKGLAAMGMVLRTMKADGTDLNDSRATKLTAALFAETIVTDYELYTAGVGALKGKEVRIPYSVKKCADLLTKLPKLMSATSQAATQWTKFRRANAADAVKS